MKKFLRRHISLMLALRYLNPLRTMFSIITLICLLGVSLGVMVLIVVLSVMGGLQRDMQEKMLAYSPHYQVCEINPLGQRIALQNWQEISEKLSKVPGVVSAYAQMDDYALLQSMNGQRPCNFRAIDTEDAAQLADLAPLLKEGSFDLAMGENAVISSILAESIGASVGDTIRLFTTRNSEEISRAYAHIDQPLASKKDAARFEKMKGLFGTKLLLDADVEPVYSFLNELSTQNLRPAESRVIFALLEILDASSLSDSATGAAATVSFPEGSAEAWAQQVALLDHFDVEKDDIEAMRSIKSLVMPKDMEVLGIYQATQHVQSPDMFIPLVIGQELTGLEDDVVQGISVRVDDPYKMEGLAEKLSEVLPPLENGNRWYLQSWYEQYAQWAELIQKERTMMSFVLSFIALIAAFCIMAVMFTVSIQRKREIAVLQALGATPAKIVRVFLWQGVIIGIIGSLLGVALALLVLHYRLEIQSVLASVGMDPFPMAFHGVALPCEINFTEVWNQALRAFVMVVIATVVPALITAYQDPAKALRSN